MSGTLIGLLAFIACNPDKKDLDEDGYVGAEDCNDDDASVHPGQDEVCDGIDNDCDGGIDNGATDATTWYADADADGFGGQLTLVDCEQPSGYLATSDDCDDTDAAVNLDASEVCDGIDNDCDGLVDGDDDSVDLSTSQTWYADVDGDGYGQDSVSEESCSQPDGYVLEGGDCDDGDATYNPATRWYEDSDGDGYGAPDYYVESCEAVSGYVLDWSDCDDLDATINVDGFEVCDGADNDCDGLTDDEDDAVDVTTMTDWYIDADGDGYGDETATAVTQCAQPSGTANDNTDCDDAEGTTNPGMEEICDDGADNDCSGDAPECGIGDFDTDDANVSGTGEGTSEYYGRNAKFFDYNGDGTTDIAVGAYGVDEGGTNAGAIYVTYGPATSLNAEDADVTLYGDETYAYAGMYMATGDVDDDGADDLITGGYYASYGYGTVWVTYGGTTSGDLSDVSAYWNGTDSYEYMGYAVASDFDLNADGIDDIAFGQPYDDQDYSSSGTLRIVYGSTTAWSGAQDLGDADLTMYGIGTYAYAGHINGLHAGDLDGDGTNDLAVHQGSSSFSGTSGLYLYHGSTSSIADLSDYDAVIGGSNYAFGRPAVIEDIDGDGYSDILAGEPYGSSYYGNMYVLLGTASGWDGAYDAASDSNWMATGSVSYDYMGFDLQVGDLDGDGNNDVIGGSPYWDDSTAGTYSNGKAWIFTGPLSAGSWTDADANASVAGTGQYNYVGYDGLEVADWDGDGVDDLHVGAYGAESYTGLSNIFYGGSM